MTTSALQLQQLLHSVSAKKTEASARFVDVLTDELGLSGVDGRIDAVSLLLRQVNRVLEDFEALDLDENSKITLGGFLRPFRGLLTYSQVNMDMQNARKNFLSGDSIVGLVSIHSALSGKLERIELKEDISSLLADASSILKSLEEVELPASLDRILRIRVVQIKTALECYRYLGAEELQAAIESLVGVSVMNAGKPGESSTESLWEKVRGLVYKSKVALDTAQVASSNAVKTADNVLALGDLAQKMLSGPSS